MTKALKRIVNRYIFKIYEAKVKKARIDSEKMFCQGTRDWEGHGSWGVRNGKQELVDFEKFTNTK